MLRAININWDTDGDMEMLENLPKEVNVSNELTDAYNNGDATAEDISNWLSDTIGFCHNGFHIVEE